MDNDVPTYNELMNFDDAVFVSDYQGYIYVKLHANDTYDNTIWKVNKKTHEVVYMMYTDYFEIMDRVTYIKKPDWMD